MPEAIQSTQCRTQKAKGIFSLYEKGFNVPPFEVYGIESFKQFADENGQQCLFPPQNAFECLLNRFVRPCPTVPRHGFVDSRPVYTLQEAIDIINETYNVEENAEIVSMPFIKAEYSAIWTNGQLIIGKGNDGATSGKSSRTIPILGTPKLGCRFQEAMELAHITDAPYVELLWHKPYEHSLEYENLFVQLRNGPVLPSSTDFIPYEVEINKVVIAEGDLLEWETKAKGFQKGTVVYHPNGSLASHYAVHCVLNNIPVLITKEPKIGELLIPTEEVRVPNPKAIKAGFLMGCNSTIDYAIAGYVMLVGCHSTSVWLGKYDVLLGFALGCAYRLTVTAALGEARHSPKRKRKPSRNAIYSRCWYKILSTGTRARYLRALHSFEHDKWGKSYGGQKWLEFSRYAGRIFNAVLDEDVTTALSELNGCVHAAHNGGWAFNKFMTDDILNMAADSPLLIALRCAPRLYDAIIAYENITETDLMKGKHRFDLDKYNLTPSEEKRASYLDEEDCEDGYEEEECDCGSCDCEYCNPGNDCGDSDCPTCHPKKTEINYDNVTHVQATLKGDIFHIQFKVANEAGYHTKNINLLNKEFDYVKLLKNYFDNCTDKIESLSGSKSYNYVKAFPHGQHSSYYIGLENGIFLSNPFNFKFCFNLETGHC